MRLKLYLLATALLSICFVSSCKKSNAPANISGTVTYNNAPLTAGSISFHTKAGVFNRPLSANGSYEATDMPEGEAAVTIETESASPNKKSQAYGGKGQAVSPTPEGVNKASRTYIRIPERYSHPDTST